MRSKLDGAKTSLSVCGMRVVSCPVRSLVCSATRCVPHTTASCPGISLACSATRCAPAVTAIAFPLLLGSTQHQRASTELGACAIVWSTARTFPPLTLLSTPADPLVSQGQPGPCCSGAGRSAAPDCTGDCTAVCGSTTSTVKLSTLCCDPADPPRTTGTGSGTGGGAVAALAARDCRVPADPAPLVAMCTGGCTAQALCRAPADPPLAMSASASAASCSCCPELASAGSTGKPAKGIVGSTAPHATPTRSPASASRHIVLWHGAPA